MLSDQCTKLESTEKIIKFEKLDKTEKIISRIIEECGGFEELMKLLAKLKVRRFPIISSETIQEIPGKESTMVG